MCDIKFILHIAHWHFSFAACMIFLPCHYALWLHCGYLSFYVAAFRCDSALFHREACVLKQSIQHSSVCGGPNDSFGFFALPPIHTLDMSSIVVCGGECACMGYSVSCSVERLAIRWESIGYTLALALFGNLATMLLDAKNKSLSWSDGYIELNILASVRVEKLSFNPSFFW